jgi:hypothetical protein
MTFNVSEFYDQLTKEGIIFCFCGSASQLIVEGIGETLLKRMEAEQTDSSVVGKVFQVFVEQMQNIVRHSAEKIVSDKNQDEQLRAGIVVVGKKKDRFFVRCGNFVENDQAEQLRNKLPALQAMTKDELKALYREERRKVASQKGMKGAGLGFIDMARKASEPIDFEITRIDEKRSFFSMTTII